MKKSVFYTLLMSCLLVLSFRLEGWSEFESNVEILNRSPGCFWNEEKCVFQWGQGSDSPTVTKGGYQSKGSAGVVPFVFYQGEVYVLLARETWGVDRDKYCDLGGAVEAYGSKHTSPSVDSFLYTLLKEGEEESGGLYRFTESNVLETAYVVSYVYRDAGVYKGFESVIAFCEVKSIFYNEQFIAASQQCATELVNLGLCPWGYQEKDDYQWIDISSLIEFLRNSD